MIKITSDKVGGTFETIEEALAAEQKAEEEQKRRDAERAERLKKEKEEQAKREERIQSLQDELKAYTEAYNSAFKEYVKLKYPKLNIDTPEKFKSLWEFLM